MHPHQQREAVQEVLDRIGYVDALVVREDEHGKLWIVDGHLRAGLDPDTIVPVLLTDLSEEEAGVAMLSIDPLAAMADADTEALAERLEGLDEALPDALNSELQTTLDEFNPWGTLPPAGQDEADTPLLDRLVVRCKADQTAAVRSALAAALAPFGEAAQLE